MNRCRFKYISFVFFISLVVSLFINCSVWAQAQNLVLEAEQHWETYGIGGTCISGTHNFAVADVDDDGFMEMITGGYAYSMETGNRTTLGAPFKIWSWSGSGHNLTLEKSESWPGSISVVYAGDANGDGINEIITAGNVINNSSSFSALKFWTWDGQNLALRGSYDRISVSSIFIGDVDNNYKPEVVTVGRTVILNQSVAQLSVWNWDENNLTLKQRVEWSGSEGARANSVYAGDLNNDGTVEIVTGGYVNQIKNSSGHLCVWKVDGAGLSLIATSEWRLADGYAVDVTGNNIMGNTMVYNVKIDDVDSDGFLEIVTGGFTYDGKNACAQIKIWNWTGQNLNLETNREWSNLDITELKCISLNDVDGDGSKDIVTSGVTAGAGSWAPDSTDKERAELRVWNWNGNTLTLKQSIDWIIGEGVCAWNLGTGDVDNNGAVEMVTVGCMYINTLCDPDLRIWSLPAVPASPAFPYLIVTIVGVTALGFGAIGAAFLLTRKKPKS
jgi:hypothetical protein